MSYENGNLPHLLQIILRYQSEAYKDILKEIILVWNSVLEKLPSEIHKLAAMIQKEDGITNSSAKRLPSGKKPQIRVVLMKKNTLFNRFNPAIRPQTQSVMFSDDDDSPTPPLQMRLALRLWACGNANRLLGSKGRDFKFSDYNTRVQGLISGFRLDSYILQDGDAGAQMVLPDGNMTPYSCYHKINIFAIRSHYVYFLLLFHLVEAIHTIASIYSSPANSPRR